MTRKTIHGIDPYAPGGIDALLDFHRAFWADATMDANKSDDDAEDPPGGDEDDEDADDQDEDGADDDGDGDGDDAALGDKGKKALDAMKKKMRAARKQAREAKAELARLQSGKKTAKAGDKDGDDGETTVEQARKEARDEVLAEATRRVVRSEVKAAAAGKIANPALALKLLDLDEIEVDDDGNVDQDSVAEAIEELLEENPFLAAQGSQGKFDSARGKQRRKQQLKKADLTKMTPVEIEKARSEGRLDHLMGKR